MNTALNELYQFVRDLRHSMNNDDWQHVAELDSQCRGLVSRAIDEMSGLQDHDAQQHYSHVLQGLADLYEQLQSRCIAARNSVAANLETSQRGRRAQKVYTLVDA